MSAAAGAGEPVWISRALLDAVVHLATDAWSEERMAEWIREHTVPLE